MASTSDNTSQPPEAATNAVLVQSAEVPPGTQKVEEIDFNAFKGRPITVEDMMAGMKHMGFQASSMGEAVRIINDMVSVSVLGSMLPPGRNITKCADMASSEPGEIQKRETRRPFFLVTPRT